MHPGSSVARRLGDAALLRDQHTADKLVELKQHPQVCCGHLLPVVQFGIEEGGEDPTIGPRRLIKLSGVVEVRQQKLKEIAVRLDSLQFVILSQKRMAHHSVDLKVGFDVELDDHHVREDGEEEGVHYERIVAAECARLAALAVPTLSMPDIFNS